jgi:ParB family chromosome partitioning protein
MGKRIDLSALATTQVLEAPVPQLLDAPARLRQVPLGMVAPNPINPRQEQGDLSDLESMQTMGQLQPCAVVSRTAFLAIYPEHSARVGNADYVVVAGSRRRHAAEHFGLATLDIVVRDALAADRSVFYAASVSENIDRQQLNPLEEARAVEHLVGECGSGTKAGEILGRSKGWVSQRLALLKLSPEMQTLLRTGELPLRDARRLAGLPADQQAETWRNEQRLTGNATDGGVAADLPRGLHQSSPVKSSTTDRPKQIRIPADADVQVIAKALRDRLQPDDLRLLAEALTAQLG